MAEQPKLTLYRMVLASGACPYGEQARAMLEEAGMAFEEHILGTREEVEAFMAEHGVDTTPQTFIDGKRIGGSKALERFLASERAGA